MVQVPSFKSIKYNQKRIEMREREKKTWRQTMAKKNTVHSTYILLFYYVEKKIAT